MKILSSFLKFIISVIITFMIMFFWAMMFNELYSSTPDRVVITIEKDEKLIRIDSTKWEEYRKKGYTAHIKDVFLTANRGLTKKIDSRGEVYTYHQSDIYSHQVYRVVGDTIEPIQSLNAGTQMMTGILAIIFTVLTYRIKKIYIKLRNVYTSLYKSKIDK